MLSLALRRHPKRMMPGLAGVAAARLARAPTVSSFRRFAAVSPRQREAALPVSPYTELDDEEFVGMNGGQIFAKMMKHMGVKHVFGYPGGAILPIFDGIYGNEDFDFILPRHEQGAGHMAEGYAKATGKPGVVIVTSGPGATNTVTPLQDALSDGVPIVVFTGQVPTSAIGSDAFQEADIIGITRSCTKWNTMVTKISDLPRVIREAFHIATSGRPGPVLVDLPKDVTAAVLGKYASSTPSLPSIQRRKMVNADSTNYKKSLQRAADMINKAEKPILYCGQGVMDGAQQLGKLAEKGQIPVTTTLMGMGAFDELNPLSLHMLGMHGSAYANYAMQSADCIIGLGARFDDRVTGNLKFFAPAAKAAALEGRGGIIHVDVLPKNINKVVPADVAVVGDCVQVMEDLLPLINEKNRPDWHAQCNKWKADTPFQYPRNTDAKGNQVGPLKPQQVLEEVNRQLMENYNAKDVIISTGVGQHQMWAAQYIRWREPRTFVTSGGLGTMGFGLPSAIGAKVACPDKMVIDVDGDASLSMTCMELQTAAEFNIGVKVLLLNNDFQGMVKQWQDLFYDKRYSGTVMRNPNWVKLAEAMHCTGLKVTKNEDLEAKVREFLECDGPVLLDAVVCKDEHVYPMVPAGKALHELMLGPECGEYKPW